MFYPGVVQGSSKAGYRIRFDDGDSKARVTRIVHCAELPANLSIMAKSAQADDPENYFEARVVCADADADTLVVQFEETDETETVARSDIILPPTSVLDPDSQPAAEDELLAEEEEEEEEKEGEEGEGGEGGGDEEEEEEEDEVEEFDDDTDRRRDSIIDSSPARDAAASGRSRRAGKTSTSTSPTSAQHPTSLHKRQSSTLVYSSDSLPRPLSLCFSVFSPSFCSPNRAGRRGGTSQTPAVADTLGPMPKNEDLFRGWAFVLTLSGELGEARPYLRRQIEAGNGVVCETLGLDHYKAVAHRNQLLLIANEPRRTQKYLTALMLGVPCVSHKWVTDCCKLGTTLDLTYVGVGVAVELNCRRHQHKANQPLVCCLVEFPRAYLLPAGVNLHNENVQQRYDPRQTAHDARKFTFDGVHAMCVRSEAFLETLLQLGGATYVRLSPAGSWKSSLTQPHPPPFTQPTQWAHSHCRCGE